MIAHFLSRANCFFALFKKYTALLFDLYQLDAMASLLYLITENCKSDH
jgi:hypothetical protein